MSNSIVVTPNGSVTVTPSGGVVSGGGGGGWTVIPNLGNNPTVPLPPAPASPQPTPPPNVTFTVQYLADGVSVSCSLVGATPNSILWSFSGYGQFDVGGGTATGTPVVHTFYRAGTYGIGMEANYGGKISIAIQYVTVAGAPVIPVASFTSTVDGLAVLFTNSSNYAAGSVAWDFGDGDVFSGQSVIHVYDEPGTYTVKMTADSLISTSAVTVALMTGFGPIFWTELIHANEPTEYGVNYNLAANSSGGVNLASGKSTQTINSADEGSGVIAHIDNNPYTPSRGDTTLYAPYFGLAHTDTLPSPASLMYGICFYYNLDTLVDYAFVVESGVVVNQLDPAIIAAIGQLNIYFSITINASGQVEYRYGTVTWNAGNFVSYGPSTLWYTSTVVPVFPLFAAASLSYKSYPV